MALCRRLVEPDEAGPRVAGVEQHLAVNRLRLGHAFLRTRTNQRRPLVRRTGQAGGDFVGRKMIDGLVQNFTPTVAKAERPGAIEA